VSSRGEIELIADLLVRAVFLRNTSRRNRNPRLRYAALPPPTP
jgi:hypothetical protein